MANIGVALETDQLVLTRGRDFKWEFTNVDSSNPPKPQDFPDGNLFFELDTHGEHNSRSHIDMTGANGGSYSIGITGGNTSSPLPFDASQDVLKQAIEGLTGIGTGNVSVLGTYTPQWIFRVNWSAAMSLSAGVVDAFNSAVTAAFNTLDFITGGLGVWLSGHYETHAYEFALTYKGSLLEQELVNFAAGVIGTVIGVIQGAINAVEVFSGFIADLTLIYAPIRHFDIEFINGKALTPVPPLKITSSLTGDSPALSVVQDAPGLAAYTIWDFEVDGSTASIFVPYTDADAVPDRTKWQLVFMPDEDSSGGDAVARGAVRVQASR